MDLAWLLEGAGPDYLPVPAGSDRGSGPADARGAGGRAVRCPASRPRYQRSAELERARQRVAGVVAELGAASSHDDLQDVGRRCREVLIAAAKLLADPALDPAGAAAPKAADAKAWLDLFLAAYGPGRTHKELRALVPVAWDLAQKVTHGDVDRVDAFAAAQATVLIVRVLQQLAP